MIFSLKSSFIDTISLTSSIIYKIKYLLYVKFVQFSRFRLRYDLRLALENIIQLSFFYVLQRFLALKKLLKVWFNTFNFIKREGKTHVDVELYKERKKGMIQ